MADIPPQLPQADTNQPVPINLNSEHHGILDQTLGEILHSNPQAQGIVMKGMNLNPEQFQQLLTKTDDNTLMQTKVRDLFTSGVVQQAIQQHNAAQSLPPIPQDQLQITPEQAAQIQAQEGNGITVQPISQGTSMLDKIKGWLK
ncbi:MAG: hypothetical protein H0W89_06645 [Candidatus Levybacteria bacterium]|nr:hypothetical protein [Candidatus Levybacteria bacterium]